MLQMVSLHTKTNLIRDGLVWWYIKSKLIHQLQSITLIIIKNKNLKFIVYLNKVLERGEIREILFY